MDIVNNAGVPEPMTLWNVANTALGIVKNRAISDKEKLRNANYLLNLTKIIIVKFYNSGNQQPAPQMQQTAPVQQNLVKFLETTYKALTQNKPLTQTDVDFWKANKTTLLNRLNTLTRMKTRNKSQEQEKYVIQFINSRINNAPKPNTGVS